MARPAGDIWVLRLGYEDAATSHATHNLHTPKQGYSSFDPPALLSLAPPGTSDERSAGSSFSDASLDEVGSARKKLRLTGMQSALLERRFQEQSTLNPSQKAALAEQLNLRPRQVEVWFQNRRARTKLRQTKVDREFLKACYNALTEENRRLQRELEELRAAKFGAVAACMEAPPIAIAVCPSCERAAGGIGWVEERACEG